MLKKLLQGTVLTVPNTINKIHRIGSSAGSGASIVPYKCL